VDRNAFGMTFFKRVARRLRPAFGAGMSTAEYAVGTVAAVAFAVVLYKVVRSDAVSSALAAIVNKALHAI
jgi:Na+-transporting NADH:ubiquinone oxidoreductase subunit NqrE